MNNQNPPEISHLPKTSGIALREITHQPDDFPMIFFCFLSQAEMLWVPSLIMSSPSYVWEW